MIWIQVAVLSLIVVVALLIGWYYHKRDEKKFQFAAFAVSLFFIVIVFALPIIAEHVSLAQPSNAPYITADEIYLDEDEGVDIYIDAETDQTQQQNLFDREVNGLGAGIFLILLGLGLSSLIGGIVLAVSNWWDWDWDFIGGVLLSVFGIAALTFIYFQIFNPFNWAFLNNISLLI